jgi:hypothetical protein
MGLDLGRSPTWGSQQEATIMSSNLQVPYADERGRWPGYAPDEILPGLFQGGTDDDAVIGYPVTREHYAWNPAFDVVVTLYADAQPAPWGVEELRFGFRDAELLPGVASTVLRLAVAAHARWRSGDRVLIRCQAGVNRSGLVTALVLMLDGYSAHEAIALLRARRAPAVLSNRDFVRWLVSEGSAAVARVAPEAPRQTRRLTPSSTDPRAA